MPKAGDELEVDPSGTDIDREYVDMAITRLRRPGARRGRADQGGHRRHRHRRGAAGRTGSSRRCASPTRAGPTGWSSWTPARSTRTTRGPRRSRSPRRSAQLAPDLVLVGVQTPYDVFGQTAPVLAVALGWPQANVVVGVTVGRRDRARACRSTPAGGSRCSGLQLPAVVGVQSASSPPRYVSMSRLRQAMTEASAETLERQRRGARRARRRSSRSPGPSRRPTRRCSRAMPSEVAAQIVAVLRERGALVS